MATEEVGVRLSVKGRREAAKALRDTADDVGRVGKKLDGIDGSARGAERAIDRAARAGGRFGKTVAKGVGIGAAALAGVAFVGARMATGFIRDAAESAKISRLTDAAIKSTGGVANVTAEEIGRLAESISNKAALDDEMIQGASNLLLTFTKVRNEVGKGNDVFNQATQAAADMSVALGTDINGAAIQLGKALNDPIKGVTALGRAGVQFSEDQKKQIKTMVEAGDVLGAQKVILAELSTQFGGAAAAAADPIERLRVIAGNMGERIGAVLLPHVERFATFLTLTAVPVFERFMHEFEHGIGLGGRLRDRFAEIRDMGVQLWEEFRTGTGTGGELRDALATAGDAAQILGGVTRDVILPAIAWFNDHPNALAGLVAGMAAYKAHAVVAAAATTTIATAGLFGIGGDKDGKKGKGGKGKGGGLPIPPILGRGKFVGPLGVAAGTEWLRRETETPWHDIFGLTEAEKGMVSKINPFDNGSAAPKVVSMPQLHPAVEPPSGTRSRSSVALMDRSGDDRRPQTAQPIHISLQMPDGRVLTDVVVSDIYAREARQ